MRALVVYESMWGNTAQVAQAIAQGISESMTVEVHEVSDAGTVSRPEVALIVAGGPTHAFSLTRESTRADAHRRGAPYGDEYLGLREWLDGLPSGVHPQQVATFDTRVDKVRHLPGSAAKSAARSLHRHGFPRADYVESFYVSDTDGPLLEGELDRARAWGRTLAHQAASPAHARSQSEPRASR
jgi:hypothetical protein